MKVFFYSHTLCPGGAEKQCALIAAEIKKRYGHESVVILNWGDKAKPEFLQYLKDAKAESVVLPRNPIRRLTELFGIFRRNRDAVLFNYLTYPDFVGALVARLVGLKRVVGGIETDRMFGMKFWAEKVSHKFLSAKTICNSQKAFDFFAARGFDKNRMTVMPSAMAMTPDNELPKREGKGDVRILAVGRFVEAKDYGTWVDVVAKVYAQRRNIRATIIGYGELENMMRSKIKDAALEDIITILPGQSANIKEELKRHDIYLTTSIREGVSNSLLEAMDAALPVVATDVGDNARMVEDDRSGFVCPVKDVDMLAADVLKLVDNAALRQQFGERARTILNEQYSLEKIAANYDGMINELTSERRI